MRIPEDMAAVLGAAMVETVVARTKMMLRAAIGVLATTRCVWNIIT